MIFVFLILFLILLFFRRTLGYEDPVLLRAFYIPAGISFLYMGDIPRNSDYYTVLFSLFFTYLAIFFCNPKYSFPKLITRKYLYLILALIIVGFSLTILDMIFNINIANSVYSRQNFDFRGELNIPSLRFAAGTLVKSSFPAFILTRRYKLKFFNNIAGLWILLNIILDLLAPGKGTVLTLLYLFCDYIFWSKILSNKLITFKPIIVFDRFLVAKKYIPLLLKFGLVILIIILFTNFLISKLLNYSIEEAFDLLQYRVFNASYDLAFKVINSNIVSLDNNNALPLEFNSLIELWLKPLFKNLFLVQYEFDTIPKYIDGLIRGTSSSLGAQSQNSSLFIEATIIHGRFIGLIFTMLVVSSGAYIRRYFISSKVIDFWFIIFIPVIHMGPMFCFQSAQPWFTGYLFCYLPVIFFCYFIVALLFKKNYLLNE